MNNHNLIIFQFKTLYQIFKEVEHNLNFKTIEVENEKNLRNEIKNLKNYLIITKKKISNIENQIIYDNSPTKISQLSEKLNVEFLKQHFNDQSKIHIGRYTINLNSREIFLENLILKLTEKEINTIIYLSKKNKVVSVNELETDVWKYQVDVDTHTVETHIYRLRKKFFNTFKDKNFIKSEKKGYKIS